MDLPMDAIFFYLFASLAVAFSLLTVFRKSPVSSAFSLVMVFFCFAGIYALLGAHLVAGLQILVYTGAIMVLFIFVIMLLNVDTPQLDLKRTPLSMKAGAVVAAIAFLGILVKAFKNVKFSVAEGASLYNESAITAAGGNVKVVSRLMFSEYLLPFELTSVLLLLAIAGSVIIAKRKLAEGAVK